MRICVIKPAPIHLGSMVILGGYGVCYVVQDFLAACLVAHAPMFGGQVCDLSRTSSFPYSSSEDYRWPSVRNYFVLHFGFFWLGVVV